MLMFAGFLMFASACIDPPPAKPPIELSHQEVTVACGNCVFKMANAKPGCFWAIEIEGQHYVVTGTTPANHMNHAPDGQCNMPRRAVVTGAVTGGVFNATAFELIPAQPHEIPGNPAYTPKDLH